jgi:hypothetical protein
MNGSEEVYYRITCHFMGSTNHFLPASFEKFLVSHTLAACVNRIFIIPTILLNAISIITIFKSSQLNSKPCYFIILVQSVIDLAVGVLGIPLFLVFLVQGLTGTSNPADLGTRKRPGTSCKIEIHFWFKITQYLINGIRFLSQICPRHSFPCARHRHKVSNSFTKESGRDK